MPSFSPVVGGWLSPKASVRPALAAAIFALVSASVPQPTVASVAQPDKPTVFAKRASVPSTHDTPDPASLVQRFRDADAKVEIAPPADWQPSPATSLDRTADDDLYEVARFQPRLRDAALYAQPLPVTSGLLADAGAILSIALAREGSGLQDLRVDRAAEQVQLPGATAIDSESSYEGVTTFARTIVARGTGRVAVVRAFVPSADRDALAPIVLAAIASARVEAEGPLGPAYVPPAPPPAPEPALAPAATAAIPDPASTVRAQIIHRARDMLGTPYVWGGNVLGRAMDCSAYVSAAWGVARYTTDSIWSVAVGIPKDALLPGDALNLETWRDPTRRGHIRLFDAWANAERTLVWVYEETPPRAIHRVIAYDPAYRPIRLAWLGGGGVAPLVPAPAAMPVPRLVQPIQPTTTRRPTVATPRPTRTPRPTATPRPSTTPRPSATPAATPGVSASPRATTAPAATGRPSATVRPTPTPTARAATATAAARRPAPTPRPTPAPKGP